MRFLRKLALKLTLLVVLVVAGLKYGQPYIMQAAAGLGVDFSSEESDLMGTVLKSALRFVSGTGKRDELAGELSDKLYSGRPGADQMSELGIELVKPGGGSPTPAGAANVTNAQPSATVTDAQPAASSPAKQRARAHAAVVERLASNVHTDLLAAFWEQTKPYRAELAVVPAMLLGLGVMRRMRRRRAREDELMPAVVAIKNPAEIEAVEMKHAVHSLSSEDFELLVALIYQRQGYRVSMPAGAGGGRGADFTLARKSERVLVQCKRLSLEHRVPVERVRDLHEAVTAAGATRGMYVASCGFTWDARYFAKANKMTLINARVLDELIAGAREKPDEDLLAVASWVPKLMSKVELTPPLCPTCEATMDQISASNGSVWVCSQRPECRGRRSARKHQKAAPTAARNPSMQAQAVNG
jgi:hypothetical protein